MLIKNITLPWKFEYIDGKKDESDEEQILRYEKNEFLLLDLIKKRPIDYLDLKVDKLYKSLIISML